VSMTLNDQRADVKILFALTLVHFIGDFYNSFIIPVLPEWFRVMRAGTWVFPCLFLSWAAPFPLADYFSIRSVLGMLAVIPLITIILIAFFLSDKRG
jgi:hypothetical protein